MSLGTLGYCPLCGCEVSSRTKGPPYADYCRGGHCFPSSLSLQDARGAEAVRTFIKGLNGIPRGETIVAVRTMPANTPATAELIFEKQHAELSNRLDAYFAAPIVAGQGLPELPRLEQLDENKCCKCHCGLKRRVYVSTAPTLVFCSPECRDAFRTELKPELPDMIW